MTTQSIQQLLAQSATLWPEQAVMFNEQGQLLHSDSLAPGHYIVGWSADSANGAALWQALHRGGERCYIYPSRQLLGKTIWCLGSSLSLTTLKERIAPLQAHFDVVVTDHIPDLRRPGLLVMDMDSTTIQIECIDEIAKLAGVGEQVSAVTASAMRGELDFSQSLRSRVALLKDAPESILSAVAGNLPLMPGLEVLLSHLQLNGWKVALASGGFTYFADALRAQLGFDAVFANQLGIENGHLTGLVQGDIVDARYKANVLGQLREQWQIDASQTMAVGDGANDLPMLAQSSLGVALHAKPIVREQAKISLTHSNLDGILYVLSAGLSVRGW